MSARRLPPALLALSPGDLDPGRARVFPSVVASAAGAGLMGVLLREPMLGDRALLQLARSVRPLLGEAGWLGLHDRAHLAEAAGADGLHLGGQSLPPADVRSWLAPRVAIGLSTHSDDDPLGPPDADYVLHAPVFPVPGKGPALGLEGLAREVLRAQLPLWGLGGIVPETVADVLAAGARGIAVLRGIFGSPDPAGAVTRYLAALDALGLKGMIDPFDQKTSRWGYASATTSSAPSPSKSWSIAS